MSSTFSAFTAPQQVEQLNKQFASAVTIYRERWNCAPEAVHIRPSTSLPDEVGNIEVVDDDRIAHGLWYFEVKEVMTAD